MPEANGHPPATDRPTSAQIAHLIYNGFGNPFLDKDFENDW